MRMPFRLIAFVLLVVSGSGCAPETKAPPAAASPVAEAIVEMDGNGFRPDTIVLSAGGKVIFKNVGTTDVWPASDPHPVHTNDPFFDPRRPIPPGETYEVTFEAAKTYRYHDHRNPMKRGRVDVQQ
jgi:plastocyanin